MRHVDLAVSVEVAKLIETSVNAYMSPFGSLVEETLLAASACLPERMSVLATASPRAEPFPLKATGPSATSRHTSVAARWSVGCDARPTQGRRSDRCAPAPHHSSRVVTTTPECGGKFASSAWASGAPLR